MEKKEKHDNKIAIIILILVIIALVISIMCMQKKIKRDDKGDFLRAEHQEQSVFANIEKAENIDGEED